MNKQSILNAVRHLPSNKVRTKEIKLLQNNQMQSKVLLNVKSFRSKKRVKRYDEIMSRIIQESNNERSEYMQDKEISDCINIKICNFSIVQQSIVPNEAKQEVWNCKSKRSKTQLHQQNNQQDLLFTFYPKNQPDTINYQKQKITPQKQQLQNNTEQQAINRKKRSASVRQSPIIDFPNNSKLPKIFRFKTQNCGEETAQRKTSQQLRQTLELIKTQKLKVPRALRQHNKVGKQAICFLKIRQSNLKQKIFPSNPEFKINTTSFKSLETGKVKNEMLMEVNIKQ